VGGAARGQHAWLVPAEIEGPACCAVPAPLRAGAEDGVRLQPLGGALRQVLCFSPGAPEAVRMVDVAVFRGCGRHYYSGGVTVRP
jgi:hypothetical protein